MFWVAGFDLLYACQDVMFDRAVGLHSFPRHFGIAATLWTSVALHIVMLGLLLGVTRLEHLGWLAFLGLGAMVALLAYEHALVRPTDLSRLNAAFFTLNGYISVLFFLTWTADILIH